MNGGGEPKVGVCLAYLQLTYVGIDQEDKPDSSDARVSPNITNFMVVINDVVARTWLRIYIYTSHVVENRC